MQLEVPIAIGQTDRRKHTTGLCCEGLGERLLLLANPVHRGDIRISIARFEYRMWYRACKKNFCELRKTGNQKENSGQFDANCFINDSNDL